MAGSQPMFVEATGKGIILDPGGKPKLVPTSKLTKSYAFKAAIDAVANDDEMIMVFLIRQDGYSAFRRAESFARTNSAVVGKLPIIGKGKLDLSRF